MLYEITPLGEHDFMYVADRHKKEFTYPIHCHDKFELNFVENASGCQRMVGDNVEVISDLDLVLITGPELEHVWEQHECRSEDIHEVTIQFHLDYDDPASPMQTNPFSSIHKMLERARRGLAFPRRAIMMVYPLLAGLSKHKEGFYAIRDLFTILFELSKYDDARELSSSSFAKVDVSSDSRRILKVKAFIDEHYMEDLRVPQLADMVGMSVSAFSRYFKHHAGKNLAEYIVDIRLGYAARQLVDTTNSVAEICYDCGFNTLSNFNRLFRKRKGCNPTEFRERFFKTKVVI